MPSVYHAISADAALGFAGYMLTDIEKKQDVTQLVHAKGGILD